MHETSLSLLDGLQQQSGDAAWRRLVELYGPLLRRKLTQQGLCEADADDVVQEVLVVVLRKLPQFRREPRAGAFRRWLLNIMVNCLHEFRRTRRFRSPPADDSQFVAGLSALADPAGDLSRMWDEEHDRHLTRVLLEEIRNQFEPKTWQAFERVALQGQKPAEAAAELGLTVNAVFIAKSRVLTRLREVAAGMLD
jgi:RNA polymerase sigma-70 factor (ECF subfamily)